MSENQLYQSEARAMQRPERAQARTAETRQVAPPTSEERLHRRRRTEDPLFIDPRIIPPGMSYEWKRESLYGKPEKAHWVGLRENHWKPVAADRHPELAFVGDSVIRREDVVLCERPKYLTDEAQYEDLQEGLGPLRNMEEVMFGERQGHFTRDHPSVRNASHVNRKFAASDPFGAHSPANGHRDEGLSLEP